MLENSNPRNIHPFTFASLEALVAHFTPFAGFCEVRACNARWDVWAERTGADGIKRPMVLATYRIH
jgi:hypothetical protein